MSQTFNVTSQITSWDETNFEEENTEDKKLTLAKVEQQFSGDFIGASKIKYVMSYQNKTQAVFTGFETITVTINGKQGEFIVVHNGKFEQGVASSDFNVVTNSVTGDFTNISGSGSFKSTENGQAEYQFNLELV
ncbi:MAG: DUF3224 domain-containing protein [Thalassotalea sp.]|nr:DUF3224 domain-containing protein [Thalassotalea sp.]